MHLRNQVLIRSPLPDKVSQTVSRQFVLLMVLLCYHLWFQIDFVCHCTPERNYVHCYCYLVLPCLFITSVMVWTDGRTARIFRYSCYHSSLKQRRCQVTFACEVVTSVLQAASSGFLWCGSVLIAGNWYVCCGSHRTEGLMPLSCMNVSEVGTAEWEEKIQLKNESMMMGLMCILLTTTCLFLLVLPWSRWCLRRNYFQVLLEDAILEQTEYLLTSESGKAAADAVTESLLTYSPPKTKPPSGLTNIPAKAKRTKVKKETFVSLKLKWQRVAHIAGSIIETLPNNAVNGDTAANAVCKHPKM